MKMWADFACPGCGKQFYIESDIPAQGSKRMYALYWFPYRRIVFLRDLFRSLEGMYAVTGIEGGWRVSIAHEACGFSGALGLSPA